MCSKAFACSISGANIAGPFCAALLADLGAEVIRIERLGGGEDRPFIPVGAGPEGGGAMFLVMNRERCPLAGRDCKNPQESLVLQNYVWP